MHRRERENKEPPCLRSPLPSRPALHRLTCSSRILAWWPMMSMKPASEAGAGGDRCLPAGGKAGRAPACRARIGLRVRKPGTTAWAEAFKNLRSAPQDGSCCTPGFSWQPRRTRPSGWPASGDRCTGRSSSFKRELVEGLSAKNEKS